MTGFMSRKISFNLSGFTLDDILTTSILIIGVGILSALIKPTIKRVPDFIETKDGWLIKDTWEAKWISEGGQS